MIPKQIKTNNQLKGPLTNVQIIEINQLVANPFINSQLTDFKTEIIKIESPNNNNTIQT